MFRATLAMLLFSCAVGFLIGGDSVADAKKNDKKEKGKDFPEVQRGPEHRVLASLEGDYDARVKFFIPDPTRPTESKGVLHRKMILNGNFLQESYEGEFFKAKFQGLGIIGYDANRKKFTTAWCDSMSTSMLILYGTYDPLKKTLTAIGEDFDPNTMKKMKARDVLRIVNENEQNFEMYRHPEGIDEEFKVMEITYKRQSPK